MTDTPKTRTLTPSKLNEIPIGSIPGELSLLFGQAQFLVNLLFAIPAKGAFAAHKARLTALISPQLQEWGKHHEVLIYEHAVTERIDSEFPEGERRIVRYSAADEQAKTIPEGSRVGEAKFVSPEALSVFAKAAHSLMMELPITIAVSAHRKAITSLRDALVGEACPLIQADALVMFDRILDEIEMALSPSQATAP